MAQTISILIPVFNEERTVRKLLERVCAVHFIGGVKTQLVVVNDCSSDGTDGEVRAFIKDRPEVDLVYRQHPKNQGKGAALHTALEAFTGDFAVVQDADLEYDPTEINVLLKPVLDTPALKLLCHEGKVDDLLAELALHRLDVVLACQPAPQNSNLRLSSERLMVSPVHWYGPSTLVHKAQIDAFPASLGTLPLLLPTTHAAMRGRIDRWFESQDIRPRIVGEFEDSALLSLFAAQGLGVFPVTALGATDLAAMRGLRLLGRSDGLIEEIHAIRSRRGLHHPLVLRILAAARDLAPAPD